MNAARTSAAFTSPVVDAVLGPVVFGAAALVGGAVCGDVSGAVAGGVLLCSAVGWDRQCRMSPPGQKMPAMTASTTTTTVAIENDALGFMFFGRRFPRCRYAITAVITMTAITSSKMKRGWRVNSPPFPGVPSADPGRINQMSSAVATTIPTLTSTATTTSERGRTRAVCLRRGAHEVITVS